MIGGPNRDSINSLGRERLSDDPLKSCPDAWVNRNPSDDFVDLDGFAVDLDLDSSSFHSSHRARATPTELPDDIDCSGSDSRAPRQNPDKIGRCSGLKSSKEIPNHLNKRNGDVQADPKRSGANRPDLHLGRRSVTVHNAVRRFDKISEGQQRGGEITHIHNPAFDSGAFINERNIRVTHWPLRSARFAAP